LSDFNENRICLTNCLKKSRLKYTIS
jgi:hypothetical protein